MPTQVHRPSVVPRMDLEPDVTTTQPEETALRHGSSRMVLYGVAVLGVIILAILYIMWLNEPSPNTDEKSPNADISAVLEPTITPMASSQMRDSAPVTSAIPSAKAAIPAKASPRPNPASRSKPKLY